MASAATQEQMLNLSQQQKETTDKIEKKLNVVYEKLIHKKKIGNNILKLTEKIYENQGKK